MIGRLSGLYAITPELDDVDMLLRKVRAAVRGGARVVQYRNKSADAATRRSQAEAVARLCRQADACFIVNDSAALARDVGADGVHLGRDDGGISQARALLGPGRLIGVSCYNRLDDARHAVVHGASYIAFGSFFPSATKPGAVRAGPELLQSARSEFTLPVVAIGGISADNAAGLIAAGADAVAVCSALFAADDVESEARRLARLFETRRTA